MYECNGWNELLTAGHQAVLNTQKSNRMLPLFIGFSCKGFPAVLQSYIRQNMTLQAEACGNGDNFSYSGSVATVSLQHSPYGDVPTSIDVENGCSRALGPKGVG